VRVVLDPNVLVSAAVATGVSAELLDRWFTDRPFELVVCPALLDELGDVLARSKFRRWITAEEAAAFVERLEGEAESWPDPSEVPPATGDPKDDYLVALYRDCQADLLVSGDSDLLDLGAADVNVVTPGELLERL
jgi:putative PIN family toxin of toxin-antitoxin system